MQSAVARRGSVSSVRPQQAARGVSSAVVSPSQARNNVVVKAQSVGDFASKVASGVASSVLALSVLVSSQVPCLPAQAEPVQVQQVTTSAVDKAQSVADDVSSSARSGFQSAFGGNGPAQQAQNAFQSGKADAGSAVSNVKAGVEAAGDKAKSFLNNPSSTPTLGEAAERRFGDQAGVLAEVKGDGADLGEKIRTALDTPPLQSKDVLGNAGQQVQNKVSSDVNNAKGAVQSAVGGGNPLQSIFSGNPGQQAQQKVGGDLNSAKNAVQNAVGGGNPLQSLFGGNPGQQAQQKVSSGLDSAKDAAQSTLGGNPLQSLFGGNSGQQAQQKLGGDINAAKNTAKSALNNNPLLDLFGSNPAQKAQQKVGGDLNSAKNAVQSAVGGSNPLQSIFGGNPGQKAQDKVGGDINSAKNAVQNATSGGNPLSSIFGGSPAQQASSAASDLKGKAQSALSGSGPTFGEQAQNRFGDQAGVLGGQVKGGESVGDKIKGALDTPALQSKQVL